MDDTLPDFRVFARVILYQFYDNGVYFLEYEGF